LLATSEGDIEWDQTYSSDLNDVANAVIQTMDGDFALAGRTESSGAGGRDGWLVNTIPTDTTWRNRASMPTARKRLAVAVVDGKIYAFGGQNEEGDALAIVEEYDPVTDTWTTKAPMPTPRSGLAAVVVDGWIYAIGGRTGGGPNPSDLAVVEVCDPTTDTWSNRASMPTPRFLPAAVVVSGKIYVIGGWEEDQPLSTVEEYDPAIDQWQTRVSMPTARGPAAAVVGGRIYAIGGDWPITNIVEEYNPATDSWRTRAPMPTARRDLAAAVVDGRIYAIGGENSVDPFYLETVEEYDPVADIWTTKAPMPTARCGLAAAVVNGKIYAIGGENEYVGNVLATVEMYDPSNHEEAPTITITSPQNTTYATSMIPVYATNITEPVHSAWWRYWNDTWSVNQTLIWDETEGRWEAEGLTWLDGNYQVQVFFNNSVGKVALESEWFTVDTTPPVITPAVTVLSPNGGENWNGTQTINWTATDPQADPLTYTVYYSPNGGQTWTQLAAGLIKTSYLWDTTTAENGTNCLIQVEASNGIHTGADVSDASFKIANRPMNIAPVVYVIQPNGGEWINGTYEIQWSANDPNGDALTFTISFSPNGGDTWTQLATGVTESSYPWDTTTVVNGTNYLIQVEASDGTYTELDVSDKLFEIANEPIPFATQPIKTQSSIDVPVAAVAISGIVLVGAAAKAVSIPPPLPGMRSRKDFLKRLIWYLLYPFIWLFGHVIYPPVCRRLKKAEVTTNSTRQAILHLLRERGVAYLREIERTIDSGFFGLMWHLQVLEDFDYIRQMRIGKYRVYYLKGYGSSVPPSVELSFLFKNKNTRSIINYINDNPGTYQAEIARAVDLHHTTVRYYILQMKKQKLFESFSDGRRTRYFLLDEKRPQVNEILQNVQPEVA